MMNANGGGPEMAKLVKRTRNQEEWLQMTNIPDQAQDRGMVTLLKLSIAVAILFASASVGYAISQEELRQQYFACLNNARNAYDHAWADACSRLPGGLAARGSDCD